MASPIFTFQDKQNNNRYFLFWDTFSGLPKTVPMNLLTFLQYWGIDNKEKVSVLYSIYPRLIEKGTSLKDYSFNELPKHLKIFCFNYLELKDDLPNKHENELNQQLEDLFACDLPFFEFYLSYIQIVSKLNYTLKRPINYYHSLHRTADILNNVDYDFQQIFTDLAQKNEVRLEELNCDLCDIYSCLRANVFTRFPQLLAACFLELGKRNLIAIDAIPHILRNDKAIQELFIQLGMEAYLPNAAINYNLYDQSEPLCEEVDDIRYLRQFFNLYTFEEQCPEFLGMNLLDISEGQLTGLLEAKYCYFSGILNFKNSHGNYLLPMIYTIHYRIEQDDKFLFLAPFSKQDYHISNKHGQIIDKSGYYHFYTFNENIFYVQHLDLSWERWSYDDATKTIDKQTFNIVNPYDETEDIWQHAEKQFQQSIIENNQANQDESFEILELEFGKEDDMHSLYLTMLNTPIEEAIRDELIKALNRLLSNGVNFLDTYAATFELYKELLHSNGQIKFSTPSLNYFSMYDNLTDKLETGFKKNYQNEDFAREIQAENLHYRPILSHFSLGLFQWRGHYTVSYQYHFQMNAAADAFQEDCHEFINRNPFTTEGDLEAYANEFLSYLLEKNYKEVKVYSQLVDRDSICKLLDIKLNSEGGFDIPEQPDIEYDNDDLPF